MSEPVERPPRTGATLVLVATFALGMISGAAILHIAGRPLGGPAPPPPPAVEAPSPPVEHLRRRLGLDPDQVEQLRAIIDERRERLHEEAEATRERIRDILTPEQQERFDEMGPPPPAGPGGLGPGGPRPGDPRPGPPPRPGGRRPDPGRRPPRRPLG